VSEQGVTASVLYPMGTIDTETNRHAMPNADPDNWLETQDIADTLLHMVTRSNRGRIQEVQLHAV
jgi:NADP-dependent 3-hydroxy acid dehydrogenase YdfG